MTGVETMINPYTIETLPQTLGNKEIFKYIVAFTYGDGSLSNRGTNAYYRMAQIAEHSDYVLWQAGILSQLTDIRLRPYQPKTGKEQLHLETKQHPKYTKVFNRLYATGTKAIDPHYLTLLDWETLAILYMDDGCLAKRYNAQYNRLDYNIVLCTENFTYGDNYLLAKAIKEKTALMFDVVNQLVNDRVAHRLRLNKKQTPAFLQGVESFIVPSFQYKLDLSHD